MSEHPIQGLMTTAMENIKDMIEVNTIIGDPVESPDGSIIIPVSKVGFGFAAGGSEFQPKSSGGSDSDSELPFGGGSGGGVSITPVAFLIVTKQGIKMVHLDENTHIFERMIDFAPQVVDKIQQLLKESSQGNKQNQQKGQQGNQQQGQNQKNQDNEQENQGKQQSHSNFSI
ncbi:sporulation protein YtfJ [Virgibacillus phasianinus]|uniref:Sporulation protein YtfJ n=1 Tax=Virgibacillus phasianinus TaxID=2017483 RepID=A0A220U4D3_9BACI|nr:GerW family sporulation protein [Virgibacillus phasianinus]ASK62950.1 sporulation protein YtfJ [Virgibacillus phasianinus]